MDSRIACCCSGDMFWKASIWSELGACAIAGGSNPMLNNSATVVRANRNVRLAKQFLSIKSRFAECSPCDKGRKFTQAAMWMRFNH
jgi:hypothetical protein